MSAAVSLLDLFKCSAGSIGTAVTMALIGAYAYHQKLTNAETLKGLARLSQQLTMPALLFTKVVYCDQDWSEEGCPDIMQSLKDGWVLLLWPLYVVFTGLVCGYIVCVVCRTPMSIRKGVVTAVAFGNSTGLPITLISVIHSNFSSTTTLGSVDPAIYLSVYLILYPMLQWGYGGWLLAPPEVSAPADAEDGYQSTNPDAGGRLPSITSLSRSSSIVGERDTHVLAQFDDDHSGAPPSAAASSAACTKLSEDYAPLLSSAPDQHRDAKFAAAAPPQKREPKKKLNVWKTIQAVLTAAFQPPVVGACLGLIVAVSPLRSFFVDVGDRDGDAAMQFLFDGFYNIGLSAVPINMFILGGNLAQGFMKKKDEEINQKDHLPLATNVGIVFAKLVIMPAVGIASSFLLKSIVSISSDIAASFYLVAMIVFVCPTANNVMVMCEIGGQSKEMMAKSIFVQYLCAPIFLTMSVTVIIKVCQDY